MPETMPLFPLGTVLLPGASLPLHIFEPRYRQLTIDLITGVVPEQHFGVVALREGWGPDDGVAGLHRVGCTARLREVRRLPDGRFDVHTEGDRRFRLLEVDDTAAPYLVGSIEWLPDAEVDDVDLAPLALAARAAHRRYCTTAWRARRARGPRLGTEGAEAEDGDQGSRGARADTGDDAGASTPTTGPGDGPPEERPDDRTDGAAPSGPAADMATAELAHALAADCLLPLDDRQDLLAETCAAARLRLVRMLMVREAGLLRELHAVWAPSAKFAVPHSLN